MECPGIYELKECFWEKTIDFLSSFNLFLFFNCTHILHVIPKDNFRFSKKNYRCVPQYEDQFKKVQSFKIKKVLFKTNKRYLYLFSNSDCCRPTYDYQMLIIIILFNWKCGIIKLGQSSCRIKLKKTEEKKRIKKK